MFSGECGSEGLKVFHKCLKSGVQVNIDENRVVEYALSRI